MLFLEDELDMILDLLSTTSDSFRPYDSGVDLESEVSSQFERRCSAVTVKIFIWARNGLNKLIYTELPD